VVHVLVTSARAAPGLLTASAWELLRAAEHVVCADPDHPHAAAISAAGFAVSGPPEISGSSEPAAHAVWLVPGGDAAQVDDLERRLSAAGWQVEVVAASYDRPGARLLDLVDVMDRLRTGCPWDREQTHHSLVRHLIEEAYETVEAIETGDREHLREELGDLLLQILFHARLATEHPDDPWGIDEVAAGIVAKLVHRHPHVFAGLQVDGVAEVESNWDRLKEQEKGRDSVLAGVPSSLPALARAAKLLQRADRAGLADVAVAPAPGAAGTLGDRLLALVREAAQLGLDPEQALRESLTRFEAAVRAAERDRQRWG